MTDDTPETQPKPRQVLPDVDEGAELFGRSIKGLISLYSPALAVLFYAVNLAPDGFGGPLFVVGLVVAFVTTLIVLIAPSGEPPAEYARTLYDHYTQQGVILHE